MSDIGVHILIDFLNNSRQINHHFCIFILIDNCRGF